MSLPGHYPVRRRWLVMACVIAAIMAPQRGSAQQDNGAAIFQEKCASCHGEHGQGVSDGYRQPLGGQRSLSELAALIEETMPEKNPEQCVGQEARQVAEYVHRQFYSFGAEHQGARAELTRMTVAQYRNAIADVIARFAPLETAADPEPVRRSGERPPAPPPRPPRPRPAVPGLYAEYFQSKGMSKADRLVVERVDSRIAFDFGTHSPAPEISADQFSIIWEGSFRAEDTGYYEFLVATQNGARLYLNLDPQQALRKLRDDSSTAGQQALIDAWVGSGQMRERSARVFLLGGRDYPIRLEFFKYLEKTASVKLCWRPPQGVWSVVDQGCTSTVRPARVYVCDTAFPADDRSLGYERGSSVSPEWHAATTNAAVAAASEIVDRLPLLANLTETGIDREARIKDFVLQFATVAYRRPLTKLETRALSKRIFKESATLETAVRRAVLVVLMSPHFLYTDLAAQNVAAGPYAVASRMAFALWDSIPDSRLLEAAARGHLETTEQLEAQARRMLADQRSHAKMRSFFRNWLELEERDLAKDKQMYPEFDEAVVADLRRSLELFIDQIVWSPESDYRQLLLADYLVLNERLRRLYHDDPLVGQQSSGAEKKLQTEAATQAEASGDFERVAFPANQRSGVLTHPYLLSAFAYHNNTSPIHRGVFLTRNIVGRALNPPPKAVAFKNDEFAPDLTMREKITQLTRESACMSCHSVINPLGFALENFDAIGRWRTRDNDRPVNTKSDYTTAAGQTLQLASARDVANFSVASESAQRAFVTQVFRHLVKQDPQVFGSECIDQLRQRFADDSFNVQKLWIHVAVTAANSALSPTTQE